MIDLIVTCSAACANLVNLINPVYIVVGGAAYASKWLFDKYYYSYHSISRMVAPDYYFRAARFLNRRQETFVDNTQTIQINDAHFVIPATNTGYWFQTKFGHVYIQVEEHKFIFSAPETEVLRTCVNRILCTEYNVTGENQGRKAWYFVAVWPEKEQEFEVMIQQPSIDLTKFGYILDCGWKT